MNLCPAAGDGRPCVNLNTGVLKLIAFASMFCDHIGVIFFPGVRWMRVIGRIAFPLFAWCVAVGALRTRDIRRYALRLLFAGLVSQPLYALALRHPMTQLSIFGVLLLGLLACWGIRENALWLTVLSFIAGAALQMDYGVRGVALIVLFFLLQDSPIALSVCFAAFCWMWGQTSTSVLTAGPFVIRLQQCALLALPLILIPAVRKFRLPAWIEYAVYPGHLLILGLIAGRIG